ncbi:hypothetical protein L1987_07915 [Smallanthus sonchifolius]|uniref:Uncharacterized protein n=1 Tax=Smallanthus sonchifolius TaxID=185202 RepID=A0ACB9JJL2_9ASTR|nr:hypothetical protein L1987_07915 [Smallanthus sonchifolius]
MSAPVGFNLLSRPIRFYNDVLPGGSISRSFVIRHHASVNTGSTRLLTPISVNTSWKLAYKMATYWILYGCMGSPHVHDKAPIIWIDGDEFLPALLVQSGMFFRAVIVFYDNFSDGYDQSGPFAFILSLFNHKKFILGWLIVIHHPPIHACLELLCSLLKNQIIMNIVVTRYLHALETPFDPGGCFGGYGQW